jgi:hypothetical protein
MKKEKVLVLMLLVCFLLSFVSCASSQIDENLESELSAISVEPAEEIVEETIETEEENKSNWLSALGDIKGLDIKSYRLRGEGPDGAAFDWIEVTNTRVALSDVRRGQWTLYAEAIGENGDVLATGKLETFLSNSSPFGTLVLNSEEGQGDVRCAFSWSTFQVISPSIEIYTKKGDGEYVPRDSSEIIVGDGVAVWKTEDLDAGSYIVRAILKDEGEAVAGIAAAMRVIDNKQSVGDIRFSVGKLASSYSITFENAPAPTIKGDLYLQENGDVTFVSEFAGLKFDWFVNGEYVKRENSGTLNIFQFSSEKGIYRFDCIVQNANNTSINTASLLVYSDGYAAKVVTAEEAETMREDAPANYEEIQTNSEDSVIHDEFIEEPVLEEAKTVYEIADPVELTLHKEEIIEEVSEETIEEDTIYIGDTN